jgi:hypothetical protein
VYDIFGKTIYSKKLPAGTTKEWIDVSGFSGGIYFIGLKLGNKKSVSRKFVVM